MQCGSDPIRYTMSKTSFLVRIDYLINQLRLIPQLVPDLAAFALGKDQALFPGQGVDQPLCP